MRVEQGVAVPMRDGVVLRADVYLPETGVPVPAVLARTPYDRSFPLIPPAALDPERAVDAGLALVCQDVRGQYGSDGRFTTFVDEPNDTYDTVEWVAAQPWCSGAVGMAGRSYAGAVQWLGAALRPPHLRAIAPVATGSNYYDGWIYQGGAFQLGLNLFWVQMMSDPRKVSTLNALYKHLPLRTVPLSDPEWGRFYFEWLDHPTDDAFWRKLSINRRYADVAVPALNVGGWYDVFLTGTLENFAGMRAGGGTDEARAGTRLLVGPWAHGSTYGTYPDHAFDLFGGRDAIDLDELQLRFFLRHLANGSRHGDDPPVQIFVMGENRWRGEDEWPLARARETSWFLRAAGRLDREGPGEESPDEYDYDPADPAPTIGGPTSLPPRLMKTNAGPLDQRRVEARPDVAVFTSDPLDTPLEVTGPLTLHLHAATTGSDTDFVAKLMDVHPDGSSIILAEGILRARFREGFDRERLPETGVVHEYRIDLTSTSNVFRPGHRIRLVITSSSFPRFDRNANSGKPFGTDSADDLRPARQTIFHDAPRPSRLLLPVVAA